MTEKNQPQTGSGLPAIVVLEDTIERVRWLKNVVDGKAKIYWATTVEQFRDYVGVIDPFLIILDHDLGPDDFDRHGCDQYGESGSDAVRFLTEKEQSETLADRAAVLVWSANTAHADKMAFDLLRAGYSARNLSFIDGNLPRISQIVRHVVGGKEVIS